MISLHKINPMVRAIGTMGAVAALVSGITFAQVLNSNTVKLTDDTISTTSLGLAIAPDPGTCPAAGAAPWTTSMQGMTITNLTGTSTFNFCLENTSDSGAGPESVAMDSPAAITTVGIPANQITLDVTCNGGTDNNGGTLDTFGPSANFVVDRSFAQGTVDTCTATATLNSTYSGSGGSVNPFELDFTGTSTSS
jgi:hypothetical protein